MTLKQTFAIIGSIFVLLFAGLATVTSLLLTNQHEIARNNEIRYDSFVLANELKDSSEDLTRLARTYVSTTDAKYEQQYWDVLAVRNGKKPRPDGRTVPLKVLMEHLGFTQAEFAKLKEAEENSNGLVKTETIAMNAVKGLFDDGKGNYTKTGLPDRDMAIRIMYDDQYHANKAMIMKPVNEFFTMLDERTSAQLNESLKLSDTYIVLAIGLLVLSVAMLFVSWSIIQLRVLHRMGGEPVQIADIATSIANGNLTVQFSAQEKTGIYAAMHTMTERLKGMVMEIKDASDRVASGSEELSTGSVQISQTIAEQVRRSQQIETASSEMSIAVADIARNTSSIATSATQAADTAREGGAIVNKAVAEVKTIAVTVNKSAQTIGMLGDKSRQISEIIGVIKEIADQTNLLALNAAIEAARAGEQGRGFAVVADEVRALAERTTRATSEIGSMIKGIQDEVSIAVGTMKDASHQVEVGVQYSTQAGDALGRIVQSVDELHTMVEQIASATEEMSAVSNQINRDIGMVASGTQDLSTGSTQITASSTDLARLAGNLRAVVGQFSLKTDRHSYQGA